MLSKEWKYTERLTRKELTPQSEPYMRENVKSEWERQCGRESGRENLTCSKEWSGEIAVLLGVQCVIVNFGGS